MRLLSLSLLGVGVALTGFFPGFAGLLVTTFVMSVGFHYFETVRQSLALQWLDKDEAPKVLGRLVAAGSFAGLIAFGLIYLGVDLAGLEMKWIMLIGGGVTVALTVAAWILFPRFPAKVEQHKHADPAPALLAVLRADLHVGGAPPDLRGLRRLSDGGEVRLSTSPP